MERLEDLLSVLEYTLNTKRKRHIVGGILISFSLLFGGLSITVLTIRKEERDHE